MSQYLLSTYAVEGEVPGAPSTPEEMQAFMRRVFALEDEMEATGTFVFGGVWGAETPIRGLTRRFRSSDLTAVRHAASKSQSCHSPPTLFRKQVSRPVDGLDPPS
jgi:hypothetical protein